MRLGEYDTQGNPDCIQEHDGYDCADDAKEFEVDKVIVHPYYEEASLNQYHDIALLKTKAEIEYSLYVQPLCIPSKELKAGIVPGKRMALAGWGATDRCKQTEDLINFPPLQCPECNQLITSYSPLQSRDD